MVNADLAFEFFFSLTLWWIHLAVIFAAILFLKRFIFAP